MRLSDDAYPLSGPPCNLDISVAGYRRHSTNPCTTKIIILVGIKMLPLWDCVHSTCDSVALRFALGSCLLLIPTTAPHLHRCCHEPGSSKFCALTFYIANESLFHELSPASSSAPPVETLVGARCKLKPKDKAVLCGKVTSSRLDRAGGPGGPH